jgi:Gluconate 2-dehydrogenase subunit 3
MEPRHAFTEDAKKTKSGTILDGWRFPVVDTYGGGPGAVAIPKDFLFYNQVTFVFHASSEQHQLAVGVIGTFHNLYDPLPLAPVLFAGEVTPFWAISVAVPKREVHRYRFVVDGVPQNDQINPQTVTLPTGKTWSRFFTDACAENLVLEDWEQVILTRLIEQMAPLRTADGERFLDQFYNFLDNSAKQATFEHAYRFDQSVGEVAYIDNILAREEHHRLIDYKICLSLISQVLRMRNPYQEPRAISKEIYNELYNEMAADKVHGWDTTKYQSPLFFLNLLRRHACLGVFSHPKYGGNAAGAGWTYLEDRYRNDDGTLFAWRDAIEAPLGGNPDYLG